MKNILCLLTVASLLCGCNQKPDPKIAELEKRIIVLETKIEGVQERLSEPPKSTAAKSIPVVTRVQSDILDAFKLNPPPMVTVSARVTEQNDVWWKWSYMLVAVNTNDTPSQFDANIQFLDRDGFVVQEQKEYNLTVKGNSTNRITGYDLINPGASAQIKSVKAVVAGK